MALEELRGAENGLQRVVQLVGDAGDEHADRGEPLLTDDLPLQRLEHLAHLPFLLHLAIERVARGAQVGGHRDERVLQLGDLEVRAPAARAGDRSPPAMRWAAERSRFRPSLV